MLRIASKRNGIDAFCEIFGALRGQVRRHRCHLSETAVARAQRHLAGACPVADGRQTVPHRVPTPAHRQIVPIRSTGASVAIQRLAACSHGVAAGRLRRRLHR